MKKNATLLILILAGAAQAAPLKPDAGYTYSCWQNGWRKLDADASADIFGIETSQYGFAMDVADFGKVAFGKLDNPVSYEDALDNKGDKLKSLPAANLKLELEVDGVIYAANTCKAGIAKDVKRLSSVRLWESGRYVQHFDFLELDFRDEAGNKLLCSATLDLVAWPESLTFNLNAGPAIAEGDGPPVDVAGQPKAALPELLWSNAVMRLAFETAVGQWSAEQRVAGAWKGMDEKTLSLTCDVDEGTEQPEVQISVRTAPDQSIPVSFDLSKNCYVASAKKMKRDWETGYTDIRNYDEFSITVSNTENAISDNPADPVKKNNEATAIEKPEAQSSKPPSHISFLLDLRPPANVTGLCPILCDQAGRPTGIPVQLSKNWHNQEMGAYLMAYTSLPVESGVTATYTLRIAYGFYGSLPSASHSQLSLIGYSNSNGRWDQLAIGCWGETICFDMDMSCVDVMITDIRMLMARNGRDGKQWSWTDAGWGGDWIMIQDDAQSKYLPKEMKSAYLSQGPCLTDVRHSGYYGQNRELSFTAEIKTLRTDDYSRSFQRFDYQFAKDVSSEKIWLFKTGRTHHHATPRIAYGNGAGLIQELDVPVDLKKGTVFLDHVQLDGPAPWWVALPGAHSTDGRDWGTGYRAIIIRDFKASVGGQLYNAPSINLPVFKANPANLDIEIVPPDGILNFSQGDRIEMDIELITLPRAADDYYGPNEIFRKHLAENPCSWKTVYREVKGNDLDVKVFGGNLLSCYPVIVQVTDVETRVAITGGVGAVPIRFDGLKTIDGYSLYQIVDGKQIRLDQSVHGNDFWQTDYDAATDSYRLAFNLPLDGLPASEWVLKAE